MLAAARPHRAFLRPSVHAGAAALLLALATPAAQATQWTDWTSASGGAAAGTAGAVSVSFTSSTDLWGWQTEPSTDYYDPWPSGAPKPDSTDILMFGSGGTRTLQFSQAVTGVQLALVSWNVGGTVDFNHAFAGAVTGCGYWGCGSITPTSGNMGFVASGEVHGTLTFNGPITSLTFTDQAEYWHGLTVGYEALAPSVPEPAHAAMLALGLAALGLAARRRRG